MLECVFKFKGNEGGKKKKSILRGRNGTGNPQKGKHPVTAHGESGGAFENRTEADHSSLGKMLKWGGATHGYQTGIYRYKETQELTALYQKRGEGGNRNALGV